MDTITPEEAIEQIKELLVRRLHMQPRDLKDLQIIVDQVDTLIDWFLYRGD